MREDLMIKLEKMFPKGYVIVYTNKNNSLRVNMFNPELDESINEYRKILMMAGRKENS
jgi:hypothetical protein